jgi:hypothetical protein
MNDWCGMFGDHVGQMYLIAPISMNEVDTSSNTAVLNNVLFTTHEGIFDYSQETMGKVIKQPRNFGQQEGLALWYFDKNNPISKYNGLNEFICVHFPQFKYLQQGQSEPDVILEKEDSTPKSKVLEEIKNSTVGVAIKNAAENLKQAQIAQREKILEELNNTTIALAIKTIDSAMTVLSLDDYDRASKFVARCCRK